MGFVYRNLIRPVLFSQDSEEIHNTTLKFLAGASGNGLRNVLAEMYGAPELATAVFGLEFPNPVGLAAGMDKHAAAVPIWEALGFGFAELGGVTWHAQPGNPQPRMFRVPEDRALINRMGFNNSGAEAVAEKLAGWKNRNLWPKHPVGINLGKSKITPLAEAPEDYANSFKMLAPLADFFVVNVSSPNTPGLRQLQDKEALSEILKRLKVENENHRKPILVKVAPDLENEALAEILSLVMELHISGLVATNTTIGRPNSENVTYKETGGLSGAPLTRRSTEVIRFLHRETQGKMPLIGVGGIFSAEDAWEKITAGASLVQIYTGLVYEGPGLVKRIVKGLQEKLHNRGLTKISEAVGLEEK